METCDEFKKKSSKKFSQAWLTDNRYKSWISQVLDNNTLFHCNICNKNFSCSSHVSRHADSACHKKNIKENISSNNSDEILRKNIKQYSRTFRPQWLEIQDFKLWLREVPHNANSFFCSFCDRSISGGLSQIYRHAESKMHKENSEKSGANKLNENLNTQIDESLLTFDERKKSAEIRYAALITEKNIPHQTAKEILNFFQDIGRDPNVLKSTMGRTKCKNIISNVLCPVKTERVVNNIQNAKFSIFIDETSDITNEKWMTFLVRYVDLETLDIRSQLVKLINIDAKDCNAEKLFNAFEYEMYKLQILLVNIIVLSCDNASVMTLENIYLLKRN